MDDGAGVAMSIEITIYVDADVCPVKEETVRLENLLQAIKREAQ